MADVLKVYQGESVVGQADRAEDGTATVTIDGLDPSTEYAAGTYQVAFSNDAGESAKVDVPLFTTKDISVTGVTVAQDAHEVEVGSTTQIDATVAPSNATNKALSYASSDDAVATVDDSGVVTGVKAGSADITVESVADGSKTAVSTITVTAKDISVTGVTVAQDAQEVEVEGTTQINATVEPSDATDKKVSYKSSDDTVATVDNKGVVTGVKAGSADVTVTTNDGAKTAVSAITVTAAAPAEPQNVAAETTEDTADVSAE